MSTFTSFEEIEAWREGRKLIKEIREICKKSHVKRDFSFVDQISRSSRSICANIAEGFESMTVPEFIQFLGYAKRSAGEVRSHLYDALDDNYITEEEFLKHSGNSKRIGSMIAKLIHYLQSIDQTQKRTLKNPQPITKNKKL
ncbi:four helix bundle protein [Patescibacteria group bacterium]|nr:four helix bundle protein [Patescibacteria group bacterium]